MVAEPDDAGQEQRWLELFARGPEDPAVDSVRVPRMAEHDRAERYAVDYRLIKFPQDREPWRLVCTDRSEPAQALEYADWLNDIEAGRLEVIWQLLAAAGAPSAD